jgi:hypothetical protein
MLYYRPGLLTCTVVVGIEHGKKRADHEDVGILVEHLGGGMLCQSMIETGVGVKKESQGDEGFYVPYVRPRLFDTPSYPGS